MLVVRQIPTLVDLYGASVVGGARQDVGLGVNKFAILAIECKRSYDCNWQLITIKINPRQCLL
jgi:hypothetical protein